MPQNPFTEAEIRTIKKICTLFNDDKIVKKYNLKTLIKSKGGFSAREVKIIQLLCNEYTTTEIADELGLSPRSVERIKALLLIETKSKNTVGLVKYAIKKGIYILK